MAALAVISAAALALSLLLPPASAASAVARTPPMGWSSWNAFAGGINEAVITNVTTQWTHNVPLISLD
jgi:hypothetical protein